MRTVRDLFNSLTLKLPLNVACAILISLGAPAFAQGTLQISFDGIPEQPPDTDYNVNNYSEAGMEFWSLTQGFGRVGPDSVLRAQNGTAFLAGSLGDSLAFGFTDHSPFNLHSVDLAEYSTVVPDPVLVHFVGFRLDGSMVATDFTTDGIIGSTGKSDFQTFQFGPEFSGLTRVEIPTYGWFLDNLVVSVPEPTTNALLLAGALGLLIWRWTSKNKTPRSNAPLRKHP